MPNLKALTAETIIYKKTQGLVHELEIKILGLYSLLISHVYKTLIVFLYVINLKHPQLSN